MSFAHIDEKEMESQRKRFSRCVNMARPYFISEATSYGEAVLHICVSKYFSAFLRQEFFPQQGGFRDVFQVQGIEGLQAL